MKTIKLIYPEKCTVTETQVLLWAQDAFTNGETDEQPEVGNVEQAIRILEDLGHITVDRSWDVNPSGRAPFGWHL